MINTKVVSMIFLLALSITVATADETRHHRFNSADISSVIVNMRAGTIVLKESHDQFIDIELVISEGERSWFRKTVDIAGMDIEVKSHQSELELGFDHRGVNTDWIIKVPKLSTIEISAGAGTVEVIMANANIELNLGVGTIELDLAKELFGEIELAAGVGDTSVAGATSVEAQRAFVSSELKANGNGDLRVQADVGVGSVSVHLL